MYTTPLTPRRGKALATPGRPPPDFLRRHPVLHLQVRSQMPHGADDLVADMAGSQALVQFHVVIQGLLVGVRPATDRAEYGVPKRH